MAHGEAERGCAQDGHCRPGHHELPATKQHRWLGGSVPGETPSGPSPECAEEDSAVPRQRSAEPVGSPSSPVRGCLSGLPGWAGAHRHGPVRPRTRAGRPGRPPSRWC
ncbi:hypothetical protein [Salinispora vitiensis]|uniref:hypothetical protein n=1 Tax=Salinispora vitiensis TaxID=999544 RepID=UPI0004757705|nr:hypothetical protein [Salinispora vitiensis]